MTNDTTTPTPTDDVAALHRSTLRFVGIAQAATFVMGVLGVMSGVGLAMITRESEGLLSTTERPYIWPGIVVGLGAIWLAVLTLAVLSYLEWRLTDRT